VKKIPSVKEKRKREKTPMRTKRLVFYQVEQKGTTKRNNHLNPKMDQKVPMNKPKNGQIGICQKFYWSW